MKKIKTLIVLAILAFNGILFATNSFAKNYNPPAIQTGNSTQYNGVFMCSCPAEHTANLCYCAN